MTAPPAASTTPPSTAPPTSAPPAVQTTSTPPSMMLPSTAPPTARPEHRAATQPKRHKFTLAPSSGAEAHATHRAPGHNSFFTTCAFTASAIPAAAPPGRRIIPSIHFRLLGYPGSLLPCPGLHHSLRLPAPCAKHIPGLNDVLYDALQTLRMHSPPATVAISGLGEFPRDFLHMPHPLAAGHRCACWPAALAGARTWHMILALHCTSWRCTHGHVRRLPLLRWPSVG
ncbi:hypothetical protein B0H14DRAFT_3475788 [Mycena olivaceomarginata]|nr:hypothetical protein B0H14DRAFT_3475788 [Mycena olivaceomarginata]